MALSVTACSFPPTHHYPYMPIVTQIGPGQRMIDDLHPASVYSLATTLYLGVL